MLDRRQFLRGLLATSALAVPVVGAIASRLTPDPENWDWVEAISFDDILRIERALAKNSVRPTNIEGVSVYQLVLPPDWPRYSVPSREWAI